MDALRLQAMIFRMEHDEASAMEVLEKILKLDPLSHFAGFERYLWHDADADAFKAGIKNELPSETYLDLGIWDYNLGLMDETKKVFAFAPATPEINYWKAFLEDKPVVSQDPDTANAFPYRAETAEILESLIRKNSDWHLKYQLALIWWSRNQTEKAAALFSACGNEPDYAPFYAAKAVLFPAEQEADLQKARALDKNQWRYPKLLAEYYIRKEAFSKALAVVEPFYAAHSSNYVLGMLYARLLLLTGQYPAADALLTRLDIIPFEGATDGRRLYHEAKLMQAVAQIKKGRYKKALLFIQAAGKWPENLGVGKPYPENIDERLENWLSYHCYHLMGNEKKAQQALNSIAGFQPRTENTVSNYLSSNTLVTAWALDRSGKRPEAVQLLDRWVQQHPGNKIALWSRKVFEDPHTAVPEEIKKDEVVRILAAYLQ
jgi:hypothetical protein